MGGNHRCSHPCDGLCWDERAAPLSESSTGFWVYLLLMLAASVVLCFVFRAKDWLNRARATCRRWVGLRRKSPCGECAQGLRSSLRGRELEGTAIMPAIVVVGAQWGDEGKGKATDQLGDRVDYCVRYSGGNNAGHTVVVNGERYACTCCPRAS